MLSDSEDIQLEPSALAGIYGPIQLFKDTVGQNYIRNNNLEDKIKNASHIAWATGGSMVPKDVMEVYYKKGQELSGK